MASTTVNIGEKSLSQLRTMYEEAIPRYRSVSQIVREAIDEAYRKFVEKK